MKFLCMMLLCSALALFAFSASAAPPVCEAMAAHVPQADVMHIPEDNVTLNHFEVMKVDPIVIPIEIDFASITGGYVADTAELKPDLGFIEVYRDGRVLYNGQDISARAADFCDDGIIQGSSEEDIVQ